MTASEFRFKLEKEINTLSFLIDEINEKLSKVGLSCEDYVFYKKMHDTFNYGKERLQSTLDDFNSIEELQK